MPKSIKIESCRWPHCRDISTTKTEQDVPYYPRHYASVLQNREYIRELCAAKQQLSSEKY